MKFKSLKIVMFFVVACSTSLHTLSEEMPLSPKQLEVQIEQDLHDMLNRAVMAAAADLDDDMIMRPFAVIKRNNGSIGVFSANDTEKNNSLSVIDQSAGLRKILIDMATTNQITASVQAMYATVKKEGNEARQGISFEIEHVKGVSLVRFLPVSEIKDEQGVKTGKLLFELESLSTSLKPKTVFAFSRMQ